MKITFKLFGPFRQAVGGSSVILELPEDTTVIRAIHKLIERFGVKLEELVMNENDINGNIVLLVNKKDIKTISGFETRLKDGDEIALLPHVQGGGWDLS